MNGYKAFYNGRTLDVYAETLLAAKNKAVEAFKVRPNKAHMVSVVLCEKDGAQVTHKTSDIDA